MFRQAREQGVGLIDLRRWHEKRLGAEQSGEEEIPVGCGRSLSAEAQHAAQTEPRRDGRGSPRAVRLEGPHRDEGIGGLVECLANEKFELPDLVPALGKAGEIVALDGELEAQALT